MNDKRIFSAKKRQNSQSVKTLKEVFLFAGEGKSDCYHLSSRKLRAVFLIVLGFIALACSVYFEEAFFVLGIIILLLVNLFNKEKFNYSKCKQAAVKNTQGRLSIESDELNADLNKNIPNANIHKNAFFIYAALYQEDTAQRSRE